VDTLGTLDVFLLVAERLSFADAAHRLGLSPSAVGKSIARLESRLGVRLFLRTTRRVSLTAEGELLLERASRIRQEVDDLAALLAQAAAEPQGRLRVSLPAIGYRFLASHLADFTRAYPKIRLDLDFSDRIVDLIADGVDVAIRSGTLADSGLMSRKLGHFCFVVCASPSYVAQRGPPETVAALAEHALIRYRRPGSGALQSFALRVPAPSEAALGPPAITCTNMEAVLAAAVAGLGVACMPDFLAADAQAKGELVPLLSDVTASGTFWLVWPEGGRHAPKLRAFIDFLAPRLFISDGVPKNEKPPGIAGGFC
jgi:DNA-binding transcriptional LysR family regulator